MRYIACGLMILGNTLMAESGAQTAKSWPYPIPCRIQDGNDPDLLVATLGDVDTPLAQGVFDPAKDQVTLNNGTVKEHYYRDTLGVTYYQPIDKTRFPLPPSGWCTWYYYYPRITAVEVKRNAKWIAENLKDYGARYVQIDDGWQTPKRDWTIINKERFPDGMADVAAYIKSVGLTPGIWLAPHGQSNQALVDANPNVFLHKADGSFDENQRRWEGPFLLDPSTPESLKYLSDLFSTLCGWGYDYFKIDGQPTVVEEYRRKTAAMKNPGDANELYRKTLDAIRRRIGPDRYLLGCWGIPTEGVGIMNGSRTGGDIVLGWGGFQTALHAVMEYYYQHNIVWYTDPDVMVLRSPLTIDQARVWATLQGLTGQALMATDRVMDLGEERVEMLRRVYPAVDIRPLDLFPSQRNKRVWDLKINHLGRRYDVIGLFNFGETTTEQMVVKWADLGLATDRPLHVFDFWNKDYLGAWEAGMAVDVAPTSCRVLTVLPSNGQIQLVSTNRHITQGWVDLIELNYDDAEKTFSGKSHVIKDDPYELRFVCPRDHNFAVKNATAKIQAGELPVTIANHQGWATVKIQSTKTADVTWQVEFEPADIYHYPTDAPTNLRVERVGLDGVNLTWAEQYWLNVGYQVYLNGELQGYTPRAAFPLRGLDPTASYKVSVETVWEDGTASPRKAETTFSIKSMAPKEMPLSELQPTRSGGRGWSFMGLRGFMGGAFSIGDKSYPDAIIVRPGMDVTYEIRGVYTTLTAQVGLGSQSGDDDILEFVALGDGKELWRSASIKKTDGEKPAKVDVTGVQSLVLRVEGDTGQAPAGRRGFRSRVQAAWVDAVLSQ
jgi:hypothetical protein